MEQDSVKLRPESGDPFEVEMYLAKPDRGGSGPAILFIHGHQIGERSGGRAFVDANALWRMAKRGFTAAAVSMPGYGNTTGPPDYCGPRTQAAVREALTYLLHLPFVDHERIVLYGVSRGAIAAAMVATRDTRIKALILVAGMYDFGEAYPTGDEGLDRNILHETGATLEAFAARSALHHAERITAATLILHGGKDVRGKSDDQARRLAAMLRAKNRLVVERIYSEIGHHIPIPLQYEEILPFLDQALIVR